MNEQFGLGLIPDPVDSTPLASKFESGFKVLSIPEIRQELRQPGRVPGRQTFGPDWIKDQAQTNGCTGFACAGVVERARRRRRQKWVKLAGAGVWTQINGGRNVGTSLHDAIAVVQSKGVPPEELCTDLHAVSPRGIPQAAWDAAARFRVLPDEFQWCNTPEELGTGLLLGFVAGIAISANGNSSSDFWKADAEGILRSGNGGGNHAVGVDDVLETQAGGIKFDMFNSWTTRYVDQGRAYVTWERHLSMPVRGTRFYLVRSTSDDSGSENPPAVA